VGALLLLGACDRAENVDKNKFLIDLSDSEHTQLDKVDFADQHEDQKVFSAIWKLESYVNNDGFDGYVRYVEGPTIRFAPMALRRIGARRCADVVERALRVVSVDPLPDERDAREELLDELPEDALEDLDREFFAYPDDLTELLFEFVAARPAVFGPVPH
jgi:hypothetical protein